MSVIPSSSHRFRELFEADATRIFRITLRGEDVFRLRRFCIVDPSIDYLPDEWNADVVEPISGKHPKFQQLFHSGSGVDFVESEITEIFDETSGEKVYVA
jgi:hypothetical protein